MLSPKIAMCLVLIFSFGHQSEAGILGAIGGYGLCQTACNAGWVSCCALAGVAAGTVTAGAGAPAAVLACNGLQGICMASCATSFLLAPTP